jgi:FlaA1/EpsC-like NDP-sugar epimerase
MISKTNFNFRALLAFTHDVAAAAAAWLLAFWVRFNLEVPPEYGVVMMQTVLLVVPVQSVVFWVFGLYHGIWRYASMHDLQRILGAVTVSCLAVPTLVLLLRLAESVPRSVFLLDPMLLVLIMGGSRAVYRAWQEHRLYGKTQFSGEPVLILGPEEAAAGLIREISRSHEWRVVGILHDAEERHGRSVNGVRVLGRLEKIVHWSQQLQVRHVIIAMPGATARARRHAVELASAAGLTVLTVPSYEDLLSGKVTVSQIRKVELEDLLGREPVELDDAGLHRLLTDKVVMVTGAGGSIGAELCRQVARYDPRLIILFEANEFALYTIEQEFVDKLAYVKILPIVGDVKNSARVRQVLERHRPAVIFHAAAYKHVPLLECDNAWEAVQNNVLGTFVLAQQALEFGVEKFVLVSTDKAVNPTNVMGATKRLAEMVCQSMQYPTLADGREAGAASGKASTKFVTVRFGNVLGSNGSVIPRFREQIARGGPVTVTHPEITRYFMSITEASQLVLQAGLMGKGGEVFVLEMGEPINITELARDMIQLSGLAEEDIRIAYTGLRMGEKLHEELLALNEETLTTPHPKLRIAKPRNGVHAGWRAELLDWLNQAQVLDDTEVRTELARRVSEYAPDEPIPRVKP